MSEAVVSSPERGLRPHPGVAARLVPASVVAAGVILWIVLPSGGPIVFGAGIGLVAVFSRRLDDWMASARDWLRDVFNPLLWFSDTFLEPIWSLALTARPLVLPLLAALTVGTFEMAGIVQVLAGGAFVLIAWLMVMQPEARSVEQMLKAADREMDSWTKWMHKHVKWMAALIALAAPAWFATRSAIIYFETIGGLAAFLLVVPLVMWTVALLLRLAGDATSYLRLVLTVVLAVGLFRGGMAVGLLPGARFFSDSLPWLPIATILTAIALLVLDVALHIADAWLPSDLRGRPEKVLSALIDPSRKRWRAGTPPPPGTGLRDRDRSPIQTRKDGLRIAREFGLTAAVGATVVLLGSAVYGLAATAHPGASLAKPGVPAGAGTVTAATGDDRALADAYSPVLALTADERWSPIRVDSYLEQARLGAASQPVGAISNLPSSCGRAGHNNCYRVTIHCPTGDDPCARGELVPSSSRSARSTVIHMPVEGATYVRVVHKDRPPTDGSPNAFAGWSTRDRGLAGLNTLIQYWYFYDYDEWVAPAFAGVLIQRHESDWEAVTVGLARTGPLFVAYSEHCSGTWVRWPEAEVSNERAIPSMTHPLVAVARGSHANYPEADQERSPDWTHCQGLPAGLTTLIGYASNIRDKTEYTWLWHQPETGLILVDAKTEPMSFPGSWGGYDENDSLQLQGGSDIGQRARASQSTTPGALETSAPEDLLQLLASHGLCTDRLSEPLKV